MVCPRRRGQGCGSAQAASLQLLVQTTGEKCLHREFWERLKPSIGILFSGLEYACSSLMPIIQKQIDAGKLLENCPSFLPIQLHQNSETECYISHLCTCKPQTLMAAGVCLLEHPLPSSPPSSSSSSSILFFEVSWFLYVRQVNENHAEERREVEKQLCKRAVPLLRAIFALQAGASSS